MSAPPFKGAGKPNQTKRKKKMKKVYTVTVTFVMSVKVTSSQSTTDMEQAMRFTSSISEDVESAMKVYGHGRIHSLNINISVKEIEEAEIPEHPGKKWFWCTLNGDVYDDNVRDLPSGSDQIDGHVGEYYRALDLACPVPAYKLEGRLFEHWYEVVEYCKNKLG